MTITVIGTPGPQGSKSFKGLSKKGHAIMIESSAKVKPWRQAVSWAVIEACRENHGALTIGGSVAVEMTFTLVRPKKYARPKWHGVRPGTRPDLSKLVRATEDALTDAGAWEDDARVVDCISRKVYPGQHKDALHVPGAVIRIEAVKL